MYSVKEIYYTLQGEGYHTGRPSIFLRFSGCNLWTGLEKDRKKALCYWCDTDFVGTDGINGGKHTAKQILEIILKLWPKSIDSRPYVILTGGEPLLQVDGKIISALHERGFEIGVETNGTITPPKGIDWICVSPKANTKLILKEGNELKLVYPHKGISPKDYENLKFDHFYIQPLDDNNKNSNIIESKKFVKLNPLWKLSIQYHKVLGIP